MNPNQCNETCNRPSWGYHSHCAPCKPTLHKTGECACGPECHNCDAATTEHVQYRQRRNQGNGRDD